MPAGNGPMASVTQGAALVSLIWSCTVFLVQAIGVYKLFRHHSGQHPTPISPSLEEDEVPHVTILRPVKGVEVGLYDCIASTFRLAYPKAKLTIYLCVESRSDPAYPILQQVIADFPGFDAKIFVEEDDPVLHGAEGHVNNLGPNPKIRNLSRGYREAKGDIIWIVDCNVWIGTGSAGRMVDKLCGFGPNGTRKTPYKFVHQLPLVVDIEAPQKPEQQPLLSSGSPPAPAPKRSIWSYGGRLEEMFMSTSHAKFYSAINTVSLAPCIVGKSNMFRKSHLDLFTSPAHNPLLSASSGARGRGLDFFSSYICEDHLIGDLIWRSRLPDTHREYKNHGLVFGEVAVQPTAGMSVSSYIARRVRWLRVRKWTVLAATLVEPGVESLVCCLHLAFALTTLPRPSHSASPSHLPPFLPPLLRLLRPVPQSWTALLLIWLGGVAAWAAVDRLVSTKLHKLQSVDADAHTPAFALARAGKRPRPLREWLAAWLGRELLALPIWTWAVLLGTTVNWRGRRFRVRMDMSVVEVGGKGGKARGKGEGEERRKPGPSTLPNGAGEAAGSGPRSRCKDRVD